jgi:DNA-binding MarR family transcriptional regulator
MKSGEWHALAAEFRTLTERLIKVARRDTERRLAGSEAGLSGLQYGMLRILSGQNCTLSELSHMMDREPATLVPAVDVLEGKGLVKRGHDPNDRRRTPLTITDDGTAFLDRVPLADEEDLLVNALKELGDRKAHQLVTLLREMTLEVTQEKSTIKSSRG